MMDAEKWIDDLAEKLSEATLQGDELAEDCYARVLREKLLPVLEAAQSFRGNHPRCTISKATAQPRTTDRAEQSDKRCFRCRQLDAALALAGKKEGV